MYTPHKEKCDLVLCLRYPEGFLKKPAAGYPVIEIDRLTKVTELKH